VIDTDARWHATLEYTSDDDGVWLVFGKQRLNLGFYATVADVLDAAESLRLDAVTTP
jgi:hypothetical protein